MKPSEVIGKARDDFVNQISVQEVQRRLKEKEKLKFVEALAKIVEITTSLEMREL